MKSHHLPLGTAALILLHLLLSMTSSSASANSDAPLDFEFIRTPPGKLVSIGSHRLHVNCQGSGATTVLFEAGLGGSAMEWEPVQNNLPPGITSCTYDRSGYGWSDNSPYSHSAEQLAREAHLLLKALDRSGPIILVGHSFGGFVMRLLADLRSDDVIGLVLVDSSHEDQIREYEQLGGTSPMPGANRQFVLKNSGVPDNLPENIRRKIEALGRMRKTYNATYAEMAEFRLSARQVSKSRHIFDFPVVVLPRGQDPFTKDERGQKKAQIWMKLQQDLTNLSANGRLVTATQSGHHVHIDEPVLVIDAISSLVNNDVN